jgi:diguanylate cyclase (GGDEF)-like protein/PAS domain S-box-containing protein
MVDDGSADLRAVEGLPYELAHAASVAEAGALLAAGEFDAVVSAYALPDGTALDVFELAPDAAAIVVGDPDRHPAMLELEAGAFVCLARQASRPMLPRTIQDALELRRRAAKLRNGYHVLRTIGDAVYVTTLNDEIRYVNRAFCEVFGYSESEVLGRTSDFLWRQRPAVDQPGARGEMLDWQIDASPVTKGGDTLSVSLSRSVVSDDAGRPVAIVRVARDVTEVKRAAGALRDANTELEMSRAALEQLNQHDELTGLHNRREVERLLRDEMSRTTRYGRPTSLLLLDVDYFGELAADHGQAVGDQVLRRVAVVLREGVRALDRPARWDRERFAIVLPETDADGARVVADRLRARVSLDRLTVRRDDGSAVNLSITASVGIAASPRDAGTSEELMAAADRALHRAKAGGRNRTQLSSNKAA